MPQYKVVFILILLDNELRNPFPLSGIATCYEKVHFRNVS